MADDTLTEAAREQMQSLAEAGWEAYSDRQLQKAAEIYGKALTIAESIEDGKAIISYRFWQGEATYENQKLRKALAILAPILQSSSSQGDDADVFNTLILYIGIALNLPTRLAGIEKVFTKTEQFCQDSGKLDWKSNILFSRTQILLQHGQCPQALATAQEAWLLWQKGYPGYTADTHLNTLVKCCLTLRNADQAMRYLQEWEADTDNSIPKERALWSSYRQSEVARLQSQFSTAVDWARRAMLVAEQIDGTNESLEAQIVTVRAFLCSGDIGRAPDYLRPLYRQRHSECGHHRYSIRRLWGDYHLARARQAAGMPPADDEYGTNFPPPTRIANPITTHNALARCRRAYSTALNVGRWIDEQLECNWRQVEIAERLARVDAIEQLWMAI